MAVLGELTVGIKVLDGRESIRHGGCCVGASTLVVVTASCRFDDDGLKNLQYRILVAKRRRGHSQGRYFPTLVYSGTALMLEKYRNKPSTSGSPAN